MYSADKYHIRFMSAPKSKCSSSASLFMSVHLRYGIVVVVVVVVVIVVVVVVVVVEFGERT